MDAYKFCKYKRLPFQIKICLSKNAVSCYKPTAYKYHNNKISRSNNRVKRMYDVAKGITALKTEQKHENFELLHNGIK